MKRPRLTASNGSTATASAATESTVTKGALLGLGLLIAAFMLVFYVQLLHDAMARGARLRYSQREAQADTLWANTRANTQTTTRATVDSSRGATRLVVYRR